VKKNKPAKAEKTKAVLTDRVAGNLTYSQLCRHLGKPHLYIHAIKSRLKLHEPEKRAGYDSRYVAFLQTVVALRTLGVEMDEIADLFEIEKKLLCLLKVNTLTRAPVWYLAQCRPGTAAGRLLLTHYPIRRLVTENTVQPHFDFGTQADELFSADEMGEDARAVLRLYRQHLGVITARVKAELPVLKETVRWVHRKRLV